jgi:hypothetical protein
MLHHQSLDLPFPENEKSIIHKEKITIYAYYILKCRILIMLNEFLQFCDENNGNGNGGGDVLHFNTDSSSVASFADFISSVIDVPIDSFIHCKNGITKKNTNIDVNSLRMTITDFSP